MSIVNMLKHQKFQWVASLILVGLFCRGGALGAQEPTATIGSVSEEVLVSIQGETPTFALPGTVLRSGDVIRTYSDAKSLVNLSDGSRLELGEQTHVKFSELTQDAEGIRKTRLNLLWGRARTILSPLYQSKGSSLVVQTDNALVSVKSSEADVEVLYEPETKITTVLAHEFDVQVIHLLTGHALRVPQGYSAIIRRDVIQEVARILDVASPQTLQQETATVTSLSGEVLAGLQDRRWTPVIDSLVLRGGDVLQTNTNASATLNFPHGISIALEAQSKIRLTTLTKHLVSDIRTSRVELLRGKLRTVVETQEQDGQTSFTVETPNAQIVIPPSKQVNAEITYDPNSSQTTIVAHKAALRITHRLNERSATIPAGHSGIIYNDVIQEVARLLSEIPETPSVQPEEERPAQEENVNP